jgi:hypothetical protein
MLSFSEFMRQVGPTIHNDKGIERIFSISPDRRDGDRSPSAICYRDDAQLLIVFESNVSEHRHVVLRRDFYSGSVSPVVPELRRAGNRGKDGGVCSDDTAGYSDVKSGPAKQHARFYRALRVCGSLLTDSKCNVPTPLQAELGEKQLTLGQYMFKKNQQ